MEETNTEKTNAQPSIVAELLALITQYWKFISRFVLLATVVSTVVAFMLPQWYKSSASVFPAEKAELLGALDGISSLAKNFSPSRALSALGGNTDADRYIAILKSGTVLNAVIREFDLVKVYDISSYPMEKTTKELLSNVEFAIEREGYITITVYDKDPQRAADMANFFVEMLNRTNTDLMAQNARGNRQFIEERHKKNLSDLAIAEDSLRSFQKRFGIVAMPEQTQASIKAVAEFAAQLAAKEVVEGVLRKTQSPDNPSVRAIQIEIEELRSKIAQMNNGVAGQENGMNVFVPFSRIPDLGVEYLRRFREVEIQYKILQFITPLYEQAKVEERRETPSVIVLDKAGPAERKSKPKRLFIMLGGFLVACVSALSSVAFLQSWNRGRKQQSQVYISLTKLLHALEADWRRFRFTRTR